LKASSERRPRSAAPWKALNNRIRVDGNDKTTPADDANIAARIREQLAWSPYVDQNQIWVAVNNGRVADRFATHIAVQNAFE